MEKDKALGGFGSMYRAPDALLDLLASCASRCCARKYFTHQKASRIAT
ncbi:MAG TPA: hypothetical protein IAA58_01380 [Candidatus Gallacutalibacter stercoravium]|nr:hypothetical protein [Candidatus Gallacutalibacter stercoravium]